MKKYVLIAISIFIIGNCFSQVPNWAWAKSVGDTINDVVYSVTTDVFGNLYIAGTFNSPFITFGTTTLASAGWHDMYLVKYDSNGNVIWAKSAGGTANDFAYSVATDTSGNIYVAGYFSGQTITFGSFTLTNTVNNFHMYLVKYDSNGNVLWAKSATGTSTSGAQSVTTDASSDVYVTGSFTSPSITFDTVTLTNVGTVNIYIVKYDANGTQLWAKSVGGTSSDYASSVASDSSGNVYLAGNFNSPSITFGTTILTNSGNNDLYIAKYDSNGNVIWAKSAGGSYDDNANSIAIDALYNVYITGYFNSSSITFGTNTLANAGTGYSDIYIAKYDYNGNVLWAKSAGGTDMDYGQSVATDNYGNVYVAGLFGSLAITFGVTILSNLGYWDMCLVKYDSTGNVIWAKSAGGTYYDEASSITIDASGNVYVAGNFQSPSISFGSTILTNVGNWDIFVAKLNSTTGMPEINNQQSTINISPNPFITSTSITFNEEHTSQAQHILL